MSRQQWPVRSETWRTPRYNSVETSETFPVGLRAAWDATRYTLHSPPLSFELPVGCQPAGEPWAWTNSEDETLVYAPILRGVDWAMSGPPGGAEVLPYGSGTEEFWHVIPALLVLEMSDWTELVEIIDLAPAQPRVGLNYCDALEWGAGPAWAGSGLRHAGIGNWANIPWAGGGALVEIFRVGAWVIPRVEAANQVWAINLDTRERWQISGFSGVPATLASIPEEFDPLDPYTGFSWGHSPFSRNVYEVIGPLAADTLLIYRETQTWLPRVVSAFEHALTPPQTLTYSWPDDPRDGQTVTVRETFYRKWVCATNGAGVATYADPPERAQWNNHFRWVGPLSSEPRCGFVPGAPWRDTFAYPPTGMAVFRDLGDYDAALGIFSGPLWADLDSIIQTPALADIMLTEVTSCQWEEWRLPVSGLVELVGVVRSLDSGEESYTAASITNGQSIATLSAGLSWADLDLQPAGEEWPDHWVVGDDTDKPSVYDGEGDPIPVVSSRDYSFASGTGLAVHFYSSYTESVEGVPTDFWSIDSMDRNNCPGPGGPYIYGSGGDPPSGPSGGHLHLTRLWQVEYGRQALIRPTAAASAKLVTDGDQIIWLPREEITHPQYLAPGNVVSADSTEYQADLVRQSQILSYSRDGEEWVSDWQVDTLAITGEIRDLHGRLDPKSGGCVSNGVLTQQYLYCVLHGSSGTSLCKFARSNGALVSSVLLGEGDISASREAYRDNLVIVNRRAVTLGTTTFQVVAAGD